MVKVRIDASSVSRFKHTNWSWFCKNPQDSEAVDSDFPEF